MRSKPFPPGVPSTGMENQMTLKIDLYWSFRSPYSYIVLPRILALVRDHDVEVALRIVHPAAIRNPSYFDHMDPLARPYFFKDTARAAAFQGLAFRRPVPDPIVQDPINLALATEHPLAQRLGRLGIAAVEAGKGLAFASEVADLLWSGAVDNWHEGTHLARAAARARLDLADLDRTVDRHSDRLDAALAENDVALRKAGHWGVPTMVFGDEVFFGQDRFDLLAWRLRHNGLAPRNR